MEVTNEDETCPICLSTALSMGSDVPLVHGSCGHSLCQPCMERILLHRGQASGDDAAVAAPTLGRCPICRDAINLFDLKTSGSNVPIYEKDFNIGGSSIAGLCFVMHGEVGLFSYHFPSQPNDSDDDNEADSHGLPYVDFSSPMVEDFELELDDGSPPPRRKYFENGCHYHEKSHTFQGTLDWSKVKENTSWDGAAIWNVIMQFSSDWGYVRSGAIIKNRDDEAYPLDGRWTVSWDRTEMSEREEEHIEVIASQFSLFGSDYTIDVKSDPRSLTFKWPRMSRDGDRVIQRAVSGVDLEEDPNGPPIGGTVVWTTTDEAYPKITWVRESVGPPPPPKIELFGPRRNCYKRLRVGGADESFVPKYHAGSCWGNVFIQSMKSGLASYHFVSEDGEDDNGAYISYEHPLCSLWPPLDDGSSVPSRVPFSDVEFEPTTRKFRGLVKWQERYGTTWSGAQTWRYEMVFDTEYTCIVAGQVFISTDGENESEWSRFGQELVYVNAGVFERFSKETELETEGPLNLNREIERKCLDLRRRLESEDASQLVISILSHLLKSALQRHQNPIDFNL